MRSLLVAIFLLIPVGASAKEEMIPLLYECDFGNKLKLPKDLLESSISGGTSIDSDAQTKIVLFHFKNGHFIITEYWPDGWVCIIAKGKDFKEIRK